MSEVGDIADLVQILHDDAFVEELPIAATRLIAEKSSLAFASTIACAASLPESIARFAPSRFSGIDQLRRVAHHHRAIGEEPRQPVVAAFGNEVRLNTRSSRHPRSTGRSRDGL